MIQFNLLPDVKLEYMKTQRLKRTVTVVSALAAVVAVAIMILLLIVVEVLQKKNLSDVNKDIKTYSTKLQNTTDLNKILTIQNQLVSLPDLYAKNPNVSRLFPFVSQFTPANATISDLKVDYDKNGFDISGSADSIETINKFTDTLKFTTYAAGTVSGKNAFSNVVLSGFTRTDKGATYDITFDFDPTVFDPANNVTLTVPNIISTRSETEKPTALFQQQQNSNTSSAPAR